MECSSRNDWESCLTAWSLPGVSTQLHPSRTPQSSAETFTPQQREFLSSFLDRAAAAVDTRRQAELANLEARLESRWNETRRLESLETDLLSVVEAGKAVSTMPEEFRSRLREVRKLFQLRDLIYAIANRRLADDAFQEDVYKGLEECLALAPQGYRCAEAKQMADLVCQVADACDVRAELIAGLEDLPLTCDGIRTWVQRASEETGRRGGRAFPRVPFTALEDELADPAYDLEQARALFGRWTALGRGLAEQRDGPVRFREVERRHEDARREYTRYLDEYTAYWGDVANLLRVAPLPWRDFHRRLHSTRTRAIFGSSLGANGLSGFLRLLDSAFAVPEVLPGESLPAEAASVLARVERSRARLADRDFQEECDQVKRAWCGLEDGPYDARREILRTKPYDFGQDYFVFAEDDYVSEYWHGLTLGLLEELASTIEALGEQKVGELSGLMRFPLDAPASAEEPLNAAELLQTRRLLAVLRPQADLFPDGTIGSGRSTKVDEINRRLERIRVPQVSQQVKDWMTRAEAVLQTLPAVPGDFLECRMFVLAADAQPKPAGTASTVSFTEVWREMTLAQEGRPESRRVSTEQERDLLIGDVKYPGGPLVFRFYRHDPVTPLILPIDGPWACLRLLFAGPPKEGPPTWEGAERQQDGKTWHCRFRLVDDKGTQHLFGIKLVFPQELPRLESWPSG